jgi:hypothetical protein
MLSRIPTRESELIPHLGGGEMKILFFLVGSSHERHGRGVRKQRILKIVGI